MACCPSSVLRLIPPSTLSAARIRNPSFGMSRPKPAEISFSRSCNETSGISPSTYRTFRCRGADHRRRDSPGCNGQSHGQTQPGLAHTPRGIQHGQTSFRQNGREQHLPCRNIDVQKIIYPECSQGLPVRLRNSFPNWDHAATRECPVQNIFQILQHENVRKFSNRWLWSDTMPERPPTVVPASIESCRSIAVSDQWSARLPRLEFLDAGGLAPTGIAPN